MKYVGVLDGMKCHCSELALNKEKVIIYDGEL